MIWFEDVKKPINIIFLAIAIISISVTVYYAISSQEKREPICYYKDSSTIIYNNLFPTSSIKLLNNDLTTIDENVYLNEFVLWNNGKKPIMPEDVRDSFSIVINNCKQILDYKITSQLHQSSKFILEKINSNILLLKWKYFDPDDAVKFQLIYTGEKKININCRADILGVKEVKIFKDSDNLPSLIFSGILGGIFGIVIMTIFEKILKKRFTLKIAFIYVAILSILGIILYVVYEFIKIPKPPI